MFIGTKEARWFSSKDDSGDGKDGPAGKEKLVKPKKEEQAKEQLKSIKDEATAEGKEVDVEQAGLSDEMENMVE